MIMAQNELQEMISRYQKELLQYARSAKQQSAPPQSQQPTQPQQPPQPQPPIQPQPMPPFDKMDSGVFFDGTDGFEDREPQELDDFLPYELDEYQANETDGNLMSDEELNGYFSAYPEDMNDQMLVSEAATETASKPTANTHSEPTSTAHTHSETEPAPEFVGFLEVTARTGDGAKPIEAALVIVSSTDEKGERLEFTALTDSSGVARLFNLPASNPANTESPDMPDRFMLYNVSISKPGYFDMVSTGVPLIGGITSRQDFRMIPLPEGISSDTIEFDNTEPQDLN